MGDEVLACLHSCAHQLQVLMDGTNGKADLRMSMPENVGAFYRASTKVDGTILCLGKFHFTRRTTSLPARVHACQNMIHEQL